MNIILDNIKEKREEWLKLKEGKIGSSDIAAVCGLSRWTSPLKLWAIFTGKIPRHEDDEEENDHMWWGNQMEGPIGQYYARKTKQVVEPANVLVQHPKYDWAQASPDFWVYNLIREPHDKPRILEAKNSQHREIVDEYRLQLNWQLGICFLPKGHIAMKNGNRPDQFEKENWFFSQNLMNICIEKSEEFLDQVKKDIPPTAAGSDLQLLAKLQGERVDASVQLPDEAMDILDQLQSFQTAKSDVDARAKGFDFDIKALKAKLLTMVGNKKFGVFADGRTLSFGTVKNPGYTVEPFDYINIRVKGAKRG